MRRDVFQAIADPTRRAILTLLALQAMTPNAIAEHFDSSPPGHIQTHSNTGRMQTGQTGADRPGDLLPF